MARKLTVLEVLLIIFFLIVLAVDILLLMLILDGSKATFTPECPSSLPESERIDCAPGQVVTEDICRKHYKCCWNSLAGIGVPNCFFPKNWGYEVDPRTHKNTSIGFTVLLKNLSPSLFGYDVANALFTFESQTSNRLHFKITDDSSQRYEVPHENVKQFNRTQKPPNMSYLLEFRQKPFSIVVKRASNHKVLLDTSIGPLQFSHQYLQLSFLLPSSNVYGLGEHVHQQYRHDLNWKTWPIFARNNTPTPGMKNLYGAHTFFLCLEDTSGSSFGVFLMNSNAMEVTLQPAPAITYRTIGGILDFYVFLGDNPEQVIQEYLELVGRPFLPSYWSLGFQLSRRNYGSLRELEKVVNRNLEIGIPYDVQYLDIDYMSEFKDFTIDGNNFANLSGFVEKLHTQGQKCVIIMNPGISNHSGYQPYEDGNTKNIWIIGKNGFVVGQGYPGWTVFPDYTKTAATQWLRDQLSKFHENLTFDGVWIEMDELASSVSNSGLQCENNELNFPPYTPRIVERILFSNTLCMDAEFQSELHYNVHNLYGYLMAVATDSALRSISYNKRAFILSRSTFAGSGKFAGHWLGDNAATWDDLRWSIPSILEFNLFGIPMVGANICGYMNNVTEELCRRWMQLGAFYPLARNHNGPEFMDQDPAAFGSNSLLVNSSKYHLNIRYTLLPYLYTLFYRAHTRGDTVARPLVHEFYQDPDTWGIHEQFLWGPGLLITPVLYQGVDHVKAYIPDAIWYDYETGVAIQWRRQLVELSLPDDKIGLHLRGGYIFPTQRPNITTNFSRKQSLGLIVALDYKREAKGELYWDNGESADAVDENNYILYEFSVTSNRLQAKIINKNHTRYNDTDNLMFTDIIILGMDKEIGSVTLDNNNVINSNYSASTKVLKIFNLNIMLGEEFSIQWTFHVSDLEKFDCYPEDPNVLKENCENRGCLWEPSNGSGAPTCYYDTIPNYAARNIQYLPGGVTVQLASLSPPETAQMAQLPVAMAASEESLSAKIPLLNVSVLFHTENMLQFKIYDPHNTRYEVPVPLNIPSSPVGSPENHLYDVTILNNPFGIQIRRKSSNTVIWDSQLPGFTFNDMFLSISTRLPSKYIYGFGETEHTTFRRDINWTTWGMFSRDEPPKYGSNSYGVHPYYMALEEDGSAHGVLLLNSNAMDVSFLPTPALTYRTTGGILDFYMVLGPTPELVVQQYTELIGRPAMIPYWALGFQLSRYGYQNNAEIFALYYQMKAADIPYDVQHVDIDYMDRKLDFTLSPSFQNLSVLMESMKAEGMRFILTLDPAISGDENKYPPFIRGNDSNVFIKWPEGNDIIWGKARPEHPSENGSARVAFPDFLRDSTAEWWKEEIQELYANPGAPEKSLKFDGLRIDMNEPSSFVDGSVQGCKDMDLNKPPYMPQLDSRDGGLSNKTLCMEGQQILADRYPVRHYDVHSLYGWSQTRPTYEAVQNATGERGVVLTRSTYPSSGRWGGHWLGDNRAEWDQLKKSIIGMMEFSLFGIPYTGANICGFFGDADYEMCLRWMQLGAFYPFSRNHNNIGARRQDPVAWNSTFEEHSQSVLKIRYTLLPYFYTLMHKAHVEGSTVVRPLLHEFTKDTATWDIDDQFMLGPAILISPVLENNMFTVNAYFPEAHWYDYHTGYGNKSLGERKTLKAPLGHINLHVREGYILPCQDPGLNTHRSRQNPMGLIVALDVNGEAKGQMFWDDGQGIDTYENGNYFLANFTATQNRLTIQTVYNTYLSDSNPLNVGWIHVWGISPFNVAQVTLVYNNQPSLLTDFESDPYNQTLEIKLENKNINLEKLNRVEWIHGPTTTTTFPTSPLYTSPFTAEMLTTSQSIITRSVGISTTLPVSITTPLTTTITPFPESSTGPIASTSTPHVVSTTITSDAPETATSVTTAVTTSTITETTEPTTTETIPPTTMQNVVSTTTEMTTSTSKETTEPTTTETTLPTTTQNIVSTATEMTSTSTETTEPNTTHSSTAPTPTTETTRPTSQNIVSTATEMTYTSTETTEPNTTHSSTAPTSTTETTLLTTSQNIVSTATDVTSTVIETTEPNTTHSSTAPTSTTETTLPTSQNIVSTATEMTSTSTETTEPNTTHSSITSTPTTTETTLLTTSQNIVSTATEMTYTSTETTEPNTTHSSTPTTPTPTEPTLLTTWQNIVSTATEMTYTSTETTEPNTTHSSTAPTPTTETTLLTTSQNIVYTSTDITSTVIETTEPNTTHSSTTPTCTPTETTLLTTSQNIVSTATEMTSTSTETTEPNTTHSSTPPTPTTTETTLPTSQNIVSTATEMTSTSTETTEPTTRTFIPTNELTATSTTTEMITSTYTFGTLISIAATTHSSTVTITPPYTASESITSETTTTHSSATPTVSTTTTINMPSFTTTIPTTAATTSTVATITPPFITRTPTAATTASTTATTITLSFGASVPITTTATPTVTTITPPFITSTPTTPTTASTTATTIIPSFATSVPTTRATSSTTTPTLLPFTTNILVTTATTSTAMMTVGDTYTYNILSPTTATTRNPT